MSLIEIDDITKVYQMGEVEVQALRGVSLKIEEGEWVAVMGPSGSGKSTLMHLISCLDTPTSGTYLLDGTAVETMSESELAVIRNRKIGFVFQKFNLLPRTRELKQVMVPLRYSRNGDRVEVDERERRAREALERVGLGERLNHKPSELSGGQQQRVAIARALVTNPSILMADEPTGNLDTESGNEVLKIFHDLHEQQGITIVMVTHNEEIGAEAQRVLYLRDGKLVAR